MKRSLGFVWKIGLWSVYQKSNNYLTIRPLVRHIFHRFWWRLNGDWLVEKKYQKVVLRVPPAWYHFCRTRSSERANEKRRTERQLDGEESQKLECMWYPYKKMVIFLRKKTKMSQKMDQKEWPKTVLEPSRVPICLLLITWASSTEPNRSNFFRSISGWSKDASGRFATWRII